jgi:predicted XRE-type DNA-binding protein
VTATRYQVRATRAGIWWEIDVTSGLPDHVVGVSQARRLTEVEPTARAVIAELLDVDPDTIDLDVQAVLPESLQQAVDAFRDARIVDAVARAETSRARSRATTALVGAGLTRREVAALLGVSHQRVQQLVDGGDADADGDLLERITAAVTEERRAR